MSVLTKKKYDWQNHIIATPIMDRNCTRSSYGFFILEDYFVGLPSSGMKGKWVELRTSGGTEVLAPVGNIGPWNGAGKNGQYDDRYWDGNKRPQAEIGTNKKGERTNKAGLEISKMLWQIIGIEDRQYAEVVNWRFASPSEDGLAHVLKPDGKRQKLYNNGG